MSLGKYTEEQYKKLSLMEVAKIVLAEEKTALKFMDLFNKVAELKQYTDGQKENNLSNFYTDLNLDGRFSTIGANEWGLKRWYPVEQTSEKMLENARSRDEDDEDEEDVDEEDLIDADEDDKKRANTDDFVDEIDMLEDDLVDDEDEVDDMGFGDDEDEEDLSMDEEEETLDEEEER